MTENASTPLALPPLFAELPSALAAAYDAESPWALLGDPLDELLAQIPTAGFQAADADVSPAAHLLGERIHIGAGCRIYPGAVIEGPAFLGAGTVLRPGAFLRGGVWLGEKCVVGASSEIKRGILLAAAKVPHLNYVGDSILGRKANLGAGTILSNFRHDGGEIRLRATPFGAGEARGTGRRKLGAVLGDEVMTGCNCVLHPGVVVGRGTQLYPGLQLRNGVYGDGQLLKLRQEIVTALQR